MKFSFTRILIALFSIALFTLPASAQSNQSPQVEILSPDDGSSRFFISQQNSWFKGIHVIFRGSDTDGSIDEFGYAVNDGAYQWTPDSSVMIPPSDFGSAGRHTIRVTARDNEGATAESADSIEITLVTPTFDKQVLIVDGTWEQKFEGNADSLNDHMVDSLYSSWVSPVSHNQWDTKEKGLPPRDILGQYKTVFWHYDHHIRQNDSIHSVGAYHKPLSGYMKTGGNLILSGWRPLLSFYPDTSFKSEYVIGEGEFLRKFYNIATVLESGHIPPGDMVGAQGHRLYPDSVNSIYYPDMDVSEQEIYGYPVNNPDYERTNYTNMVDATLIRDITSSEYSGRTRPIYAFRCKDDCSKPRSRGQSIGVHQLNSTFQSIFLGFPLLFMKDEQVGPAVDSILVSMDHKIKTALSKTELPKKLQLLPNYPNPFNPTTNIRFKLPRSMNLQLSVYDVLGRRVAILVDGKRRAGTHTIQFNASGLSSGVYIYRLKTEGFAKSRKMLLVK